ncbi:limbic system-associated membrane protein-like isoform X2 [Onthophagus taurus]|uniref:limbic system-associated membrane protein-like isoform X2 n=1 Tax=Onthophagus taurus TaxID=166361 RepID=UPI000C205933|nr:lachesin-like isoform X2 [Onthophagus taurus]
MRQKTDHQSILFAFLLYYVYENNLIISEASLVGVSDKGSTKPTPERPYFDDIGPRNVTAVVGQSTLLSCRVKHPGDRTVSWMRKRDLHILTSGIHTYTGDGRFSVRHPEHSDDWDLRIEYVQKRDAGVYECQVNTEPKINMAILLNVEDAQATISGPVEVFVMKGSTISLTCSVNVHSTPPSSIQWLHGPNMVDFDSTRGGISLETEKTESGTTSKLLVTKALLTDSGNYTCMPSNASPASAIVHVLNGEHPAAMQTSSALGHQKEVTFLIIFLLLTLIR